MQLWVMQLNLLWLMIDNNFTIYKHHLTRTKELFTPIHEGKVGNVYCVRTDRL